MKNFLLIDDHEIVRTGLKNVLLDLFEPCTVYEAWDEKTSLQLLKERSYALVIMDVHLPGSNSTELMEYISVNYPAAKVLIFSMTDEKIYAKRFLKAGAMGFVSKTSDVDELKKAIDLVLRERRYISESFADYLSEHIETHKNASPFEKLSTRELEIAVSLIRGISVAEIANALNISISTVGTYKSRVYEKLQIKNIVELIETGRVYNIS